ncbi:MAG: phytoene/squalene synthase family protein [Bacteroidetes bacterium]|nr:phytoene/squalene synthase family protein [Bacteroidota bacterium]
MFSLFEKTSAKCSKITTQIYSTSFSLGIKMLAKDFREPIYGIYGFVRLADEIVDTFDRTDKAELLAEFKSSTYQSIDRQISLNPILYSFQKVVNTYQIGNDLIEPFFESMAQDLNKTEYNPTQYTEYIYGSAEVVGLMCLRVFCNGNIEQYNHLKSFARALGSAFQKVNFLRDIKSDVEERGRVYFPYLDLSEFNELNKKVIIEDVKKDFAEAFKGIKQLPVSCRFGVYTAYIYYLKLLEKIERTNAHKIMESRIRVGDGEKLTLLAKSYVKYKLNAI